MLIQIERYILVMILDSIYCQNFHYWTVTHMEVFQFFGVDMSSPVEIDNKKKVILIPGKGPTQGLEQTTLTAEAQYSVNFSI